MKVGQHYYSQYNKDKSLELLMVFNPDPSQLKFLVLYCIGIYGIVSSPEIYIRIHLSRNPILLVYVVTNSVFLFYLSPTILSIDEYYSTLTGS